MAVKSEETQVPGLDMAALADLIAAAVERTVAPLRDELAAVRAGQPRFVRTAPSAPPSRARTYEPPEEIRKRKLAKGQSAEARTRWLDTPEGRRGIPPQYRPLYAPGDLVRLNPDAPVWGGGGKTWSDVLPSLRDNPEGAGEITGTMGLTETWEPKYKVTIKGFSLGSSGFRESELLPDDGY